jgi:alpha,alpha-trehalose phosphorylase
MRAGGGRLRFAPRLPGGISRLAFRMRYRGSRLRVEVTGESAAYRLLDGPAITLWHHGEEFELGDEPVELPIEQVPARPAPTQPAGREPAPRRIDPHSREPRPVDS